MATNRETEKNLAAQMLGRLGGRVQSKAQRAASLRNIKKATKARLAQRKTTRKER
jgi:hypothetical protein